MALRNGEGTRVSTKGFASKHSSTFRPYFLRLCSMLYFRPTELSDKARGNLLFVDVKLDTDLRDLSRSRLISV